MRDRQPIKRQRAEPDDREIIDRIEAGQPFAGHFAAADTPKRSVADEEAAGVDVVLYYGMSLYAAYAGVASTLEAFKRTRDADAAHLRDDIAAFEDFIGYTEFSARAKKYGLA